jgi:MFS family permease
VSIDTHGLSLDTLYPNAALCPFVGALSDLFGRRNVAIVGQVCLILGPIITATAHTMNIAIGTYFECDRTQYGC